ncbi:spore germination protein KA [Psychrobacillus sp. OK028]|uniref:spore germination protein n=1 Tax=Psychrobacillus sp. OK028 TaxID=1884359 RepID=UPI00088295F1|nr:spore germination protein [Psychrobacillus sp. OK028]SDN08441.1 spore germination protein KA [Psychrobacillus sp. OK028]
MFSFLKPKNQRSDRKIQDINNQNQSNNRPPNLIESSLSNNLEVIKQKTGNSSDIVIRPLKIGHNSKIKIAILYVKGMVDNQLVNDFVIESIMNNQNLSEKLAPQDVLEVLTEDVVAVGGIKVVSDWEILFTALMSGGTITLIDGISKGICASTQGGQRRSVQESTTNVSIRGSKEAFNESIETNIAMVRRIINNPGLWVESINIGKMTKTEVSIMYINGIAKNEIIEEVRKRLNGIDIDGILESGYIEQLIEDQTNTTFPTIHHTERPDSVAGNLLEGKIAIFVNGTPFVLLVPALFIDFFQSVEDYYERFDISTAIRFLRTVIFFISLVGPAIYIAATTFHQEMIPTKLALIISAQRESVPFPAFFEALIMEITFEILREAGIRMPKAMGSTISIVGALVIGQAAIQAGIVSPAMVIVVSLTAIASFATPSYAVAISARLVRFIFMVSAATFGFYGVILVFIMLIVHLCSLRSFGVPYMTPLAPFIREEAGDTIFRRPIWAYKKRPRLMSGPNRVSQGEDQKPQPPRTRTIKNTTNVGKGERNES